MKRIWIIVLLILSIPHQINADSPHKPKRLLLELHTSATDFEQELERYYPSVTILEKFTTLFDGIAIEGRIHELKKITEHDAVKQAYPIATYTVTPEKINPLNQSELPNRQTDESQTYTGKGVKIGVIDTGIDYTHPDLARNYKGGYDLVEFDDDPMETTPTEGIPTLHGTHVAGIIGANGAIKGIAPDAELYGYRALGPGGTGTSVQVIAAIEKAVTDGMDLINLSLGNNVNGPDYPTSLAVNEAIAHGVTVVIANGNSGPEEWTVGSPATATDAIAVGASTQTYQSPILTERKHNKQIEFSQITNTQDWTLTRDYPITYHGLGTEPLPDLTGKIVLFQRGEISFYEKLTQAREANAEAVVIYNNTPDPIEAGVDEELDLPAAFISQTDGEWLKAEIETSSAVWLETTYEMHDNETAHFSSRGPVTANWQIKPDLVAPGVDIISTIPDGYASLQGTSMAAPYVTGVLAVLKEAQPTWTPSQLKAALLTQATRLSNQVPIEQGMGEVNLFDSLQTPVLIENSTINFGLINQRINEQTHQLLVTNLTNEPIKVRFKRPQIKQGIKWTLPMTRLVEPNVPTPIEIKLSIRPQQIDSGIHQDYLTLMIGEENYDLPYLFINQTAEFPQIAGFEIEQSIKNEHIYHLRLQIANKSKSLTVDHYDPVTFAYLGQLYDQEEIEAGLLEAEIDLSNSKPLNHYLINVTIEADEQKHSFQQLIHN